MMAEVSDEKVAQALRSLIVLVVPIAAIFSTYFSTKAALEGDLTALRTTVEYLERSFEGRLERVERSGTDLRAAYNGHISVDESGMGHPAGVVSLVRNLQAELDELRDEVNRLKNK